MYRKVAKIVRENFVSFAQIQKIVNSLLYLCFLSVYIHTNIGTDSSCVSVCARACVRMLP